MTWIKICGTTNLEDALLAADAGADALGFVFAKKSPRNVSIEVARAIVGHLPVNLEKVGVFLEQEATEIASIAQAAGLTAVQLHRGYLQSGEIFGELYKRGLRRMFVMQPARILLGEEKGAEVPESIPAYAEHRDGLAAVLIDSSTSEAGGTGQTFDWARAAARIETMQRSVPVIVAGGLTPANVRDAIRILKPWGVDVVTGVEREPGKKDAAKVRAFVTAVRG